MKAAKLLAMCGSKQNPYLALKIMKRYNLRYEEANKHFTAGFREMTKREEENWAAICTALVGG
jgi:hypothetical protein